MSFFTTSDNKEIDTTSGAFDGGGGSFEIIPEGTQVLALASEAAWYTPGPDQDNSPVPLISIKWEIVGDDYNGRIIFQKVRVQEDDSKKRDKALRMLAAIDSNCGGGIAKLGAKPTDMDLSNNLLNKPMLLKLGKWDLNGKQGNWVIAVSKFTGKMPEQPAAKPRQTPPAVAGFDEDIPF
jgi:hypothetical protein